MLLSPRCKLWLRNHVSSIDIFPTRQVVAMRLLSVTVGRRLRAELAVLTHAGGQVFKGGAGRALLNLAAKEHKETQRGDFRH